MQDLNNIDTQALMEMLAQQTAYYTTRIAEKDGGDLQQFEYEIALLQSELNSRNVTKNAMMETNGNIQLRARK